MLRTFIGIHGQTYPNKLLPERNDPHPQYIITSTQKTNTTTLSIIIRLGLLPTLGSRWQNWNKKTYSPTESMIRKLEFFTKKWWRPRMITIRLTIWWREEKQMITTTTLIVSTAATTTTMTIWMKGLGWCLSIISIKGNDHGQQKVARITFTMVLLVRRWHRLRLTLLHHSFHHHRGWRERPKEFRQQIPVLGLHHNNTTTSTASTTLTMHKTHHHHLPH